MSNDLISQLKALKLHGMAQTLPELMAKARSHALDAEQVLQRPAGSGIGGAGSEIPGLPDEVAAGSRRTATWRALISQPKLDEVLVRRCTVASSWAARRTWS